MGGSREGGDKRGRGSSKTAVIVEASINGNGVGYARMMVVDHVDSATIEGLIRADVKESQTIKTDGFRAYNVVSKTGHTHRQELVKGKNAHEVLIAYLDEFCYRFNRRIRESQLFDRLATACATSRGVCYGELIQ